MIRLRRKKTQAQNEDIRLRQVIHEELDVYHQNLKSDNEKERHKEFLRKQLMNLPKNQKAKFVRYLKEREAKKNGKK